MSAPPPVTVLLPVRDAAEHLGLSDHAPLIVDIDVEAIAMTNLIDEPAR